MLSALNIMILTILGVVLLLLLFQEKLIYFPSQYGESYEPLMSGGMREIVFETGQGTQHAYYCLPVAADSDPAEAGEMPEDLWIAFCGNGSLAMHWVDFVRAYPDPRAAFLLVEYPGYGRSEGSPNPRSILETGRAALATLSEEKGWEPEKLHQRLNFLGHSLGAAATLRMAEHYPARRIMLISPFTSTLEMAKMRVGFPLNQLLRHRFDNVARLESILAREDPPAVNIIHGEQDVVVPARMSREIKEKFPEKIELEILSDLDHNWIITAAEPLIHNMMLGEDTPQKEK
jgi:pimeloyl-ACP methyl ester carboxylesterase